MQGICESTCQKKPFDGNDAKEAMKKKDRENQLKMEAEKKA